MSSFDRQYFVVMPAAGSGKRFGGETPKQYFPLCGKSVIEYALQPFLELQQIAQVIVAIAADDEVFPTLNIASHPKIQTSVGGHERCHSVLNGLRTLYGTAQDDDWVLVHDAARPCITQSDIIKLIAEVADHPVGGLLGAPVADSLKVVSDAGDIVRSAQRDQVWRAFTPQMFRYRLLHDQLEKAMSESKVVTDEAQACEGVGKPVLMVPGRTDNLKITTQTDLIIAGKILETRAVQVV